MKRKLILASDHAAYPIKNHLVFWLRKQDFEVIDIGTDSEETADYADFGHKLGHMIDEDNSLTGIALCGSGNGMNMSIGKHKSTRSALCWNVEITKMARLHNDANVLVMPGRYITQNEAEEMVSVFLNTPFEGGRHERRINKIPLK
jgi:ribose 5-phosphate isomerase B